jgi:hypothetical protein
MLAKPAYSTVTGLARCCAVGRAKRDGWGGANGTAIGKAIGRIKDWVKTNLR